MAPPRNLGTDGFAATKFNVEWLFFRFFHFILCVAFLGSFVFPIGLIFFLFSVKNNRKDLSHLKNPNSGGDREDDSDVLVECRDVYKSFGEKHILRGVSFKVSPIKFSR